MKSYQKTIDWLFEQFPSYQVIGSDAYKPTLDNIKEILDWANHPEQGLKFIHVAGSNGKGSVCSIVASTLTEAGFKVGLFTSPHIKDFSERIRINGEPIEHDKVNSFVDKIQKHPLPFSPSFFEITFALALEYFNEAECDICVIETGLGGRLDATNIIHPIISVITSISLEHTNILGNSIREIAGEKAGIIKENTPVVIGPLVKEAKNVISDKAKQEQAAIFQASNNQVPKELNNIFLANYQKENFQIAREALGQIHKDGFTSTPEDLIQGVIKISANTGYQGRLQIINEHPLTILDVSHNPAGFTSTFEAIEKVNKGDLRIIIGASSDKDLKEIIHTLPQNANYYVTEFKNMRSASLHQLRHIFGQSNLESIRYFKAPEKAFEVANFDADQSDTILVIGSFFLLEHFF